MSDHARLGQSETWPRTTVDASVYVTTRYQVRLEAPWDGVSELIDKDKVERDLDAYIEAHGGQLPEGVTVEYIATDSETEVW